MKGELCGDSWMQKLNMARRLMRRISQRGKQSAHWIAHSRDQTSSTPGTFSTSSLRWRNQKLFWIFLDFSCHLIGIFLEAQIVEFLEVTAIITVRFSLRSLSFPFCQTFLCKLFLKRKTSIKSSSNQDERMNGTLRPKVAWKLAPNNKKLSKKSTTCCQLPRSGPFR